MPIINRAKTFTDKTHPPQPKVLPRKATNDFHVKAREEALPELGDLRAKERDIADGRVATKATIRQLEAEVAADKSTALHGDVAQLLGEAPSPKAEKLARIKELTHEVAVAEAALAEIAKRVAALSSKADRAVCADVRPEAERVLGNLVAALNAADVAHTELSELLLQVEAVGASTDGLGQIRPFFLGDFRAADRQVARYIKELQGAGYAV